MRNLSDKKIKESEILSKKVRKNVLEMVYKAKTSHVGSAFSIVEIIVVLYKFFMDIDPSRVDDQNRDRFLLSKGHACAAIYSLLAELGYFKKEMLKDFSKNGSILMSHINVDVPGVEFSTGSLGHALPVSLGLAHSIKTKNKNNKVFVLLSDGELDEGSNWESIMFAPFLKLENLIMIVDKNNLQGMGRTEDIININSIDEKIEGFGWDVERVDGHNISDLFTAIQNLCNKKNSKPKALIADTIKGKGVSFMEDKLEWHYKSPNESELEDALKELSK